jgi:hypothetical protein
MLFQQLNRADAEKVFGIFKNVKGSATVAGDVVVLDISTDVDGHRVDQPATASLNAVVGISDSAIADDGYGLVQIYGYRGAANVKRTNTTQAAGLALIPSNGVDYLVSTSAGPHFVLLESLATSTDPVSAKVHVRAM